MQERRPRIGSLEAQLFAWVQLKNANVVRSGDIAWVLGITPQREARLLSGLHRRKLILRLQNGLYLAPSKLPPGGQWGPNPYWVIARFMEAIGGSYQITGIDAFHRHGFTEQVANAIAVYNTALSGTKMIGGLRYQFIKVAPARLGATKPLAITEGDKIPYPTPERALFDAFYDWSRFGTLPKALDWVKSRVKNQSLIAGLIKTTSQYGNIGTIRRVGYALASAGVPKNDLRILARQIKKTKSFIPLLPANPKRGHIDQVWGIVVND